MFNKNSLEIRKNHQKIHGFRLVLTGPNQPDHYFDLFDDFPENKTKQNPDKQSVDFIHLFSTTLADLENEFKPLKSILKLDGTFWISWPKHSSTIATELDGNLVRRFGLMNGLVDVKVCAVDSDWSGLKFMYRLKDRK